MNKVETKVVLLFDLPASALFTEEEKETLWKKLATRLTHAGVLQMSSEKERSQLRNKQLVVAKAVALLEKALVPVKPRNPTKPTKASVEKRLQGKQAQAEKKQNRGRIIV